MASGSTWGFSDAFSGRRTVTVLGQLPHRITLFEKPFPLGHLPRSLFDAVEDALDTLAVPTVEDGLWTSATSTAKVGVITPPACPQSRGRFMRRSRSTRGHQFRDRSSA